MLDIGFSELVLIGVVALVVIGPERLPRVARTAGLLFGRLQRYVNDVKADINREIHADELRKLQEDMRSSVSSLEQSVSRELQQGGGALQSAKEQIHEIVEIPRTPAAGAPAAEPGGHGAAEASTNPAPEAPPPVADAATQPEAAPPSAGKTV